MRNIFLCLIGFTMTISCIKKTETDDLAKFKAEVLKTEEDFKNLSQTKGIAAAFYAFADNNAVIKRDDDSLIKGKEDIKKYFTAPKFGKASVTWKADFVEVSNDGTLAYTYGKYVWTVKDSVGNKKDFTGIFHTVWKKQDDGSWKYVWD